MGQRHELQVVVDQRGDDAHFGHAQPNAHELGTVFHQETDHVAFLEAVLQHGVGHFVAVLFDLLQIHVYYNRENTVPLPRRYTGYAL